MKCVVMFYRENQNAPSKPESKLRDVTEDNAIEIASEFIDLEEGEEFRIEDQEYFADIAVTDGEGGWVFFTKVEA